MKFLLEQLRAVKLGGWPVLKRKLLGPSDPKYLPIPNFLQSCASLTHKIINFLGDKYYLDYPIAVYDLSCQPLTYDFAYFLYEADCYFTDKGYSQFHVIILSQFSSPPPGSWEHSSGFSTQITSDHKRQRIFNILLPIASLYTSCASVNLIHDTKLITYICRTHHAIYPRHYDGLFTRHMSYKNVTNYERRQAKFSGLKALEFDLDKVNFWLKSQSIDQPFVTFTIRHYGYQSDRNSNIPAYLEFSEYLFDMGIATVFIPDTEDLSYIDQISKYPVFFAGTFNLYQRQAIYELALTNIFSNNGCAALCALNKACSYIISGIVTKDWSAEIHEARGLKYGSQPFCDNRGIWEWEAETFVSLKKSFHLLLEKNPHWPVRVNVEKILEKPR
jgi:hypothetical protein